MDGVTEIAGLASAIAAGVLSLVFARSAAHKVAEFAFFSATLGEYRLLPALFVGPAAIALTVAEAVAIVLLIIPNTRIAGATLASSLLALYAVAMAINLHRGRFKIDCGCGGPGQMISWPLVLRNVILAGAAVFVAMNTAAFAAIPASAFVAFAGVMLCWLLLATCDQIIGNGSYLKVNRNW